ncbi:hypothetical protein PTB57_005022 [Vibrio parahaemolyticus]|nr:hypothetical protein [Vibrio parahaemolyticus]EKL9962860.1 hypothetical protein [Vibrio parahaemolyticus]
MHITKAGHYVGKDDLGKKKGSTTIMVFGLNRRLDELNITKNGDVNEKFFEMARQLADGMSDNEKALFVGNLSQAVYRP